jgi:sulfite reductase (NADPH) hemoprotein beta-component
VLKHNLKQTIKEINDSLLDTIAACGDVNRNVMCNPNPEQSAVHPQVQEVAQKISDHLTPQTKAYHEIWLDGEKVESSEEEVEPIYGKTYLPRKFKISIAIPPSNDVDIFAQCLGFIAIVEDGELKGFNVTVGGGMGMTHRNSETFPRLADVMGFCTVDEAVDVAEAVVKVQRDWGDRENRSHARLKYTVDDHGVDWFREKVEEHLDFRIKEARPFAFTDNNDLYGWHQGTNGKWNLQLFIQNGRVKDTDDYKMKTGLREIAKVHKGDFRLTGNQNLVIGAIDEADKPEIEKVLTEYGLDKTYDDITGLRKSSMACVALPTCGLALTDSERYLPELVDKLDEIVMEAGLRDQDINIRMTGCPNGCARPYLGEIGMVGKAPGKYNLYLGAAGDGSRLARLFRESLTEEQIIEILDPLIRRYATERIDGERFGDWVHRAEILPVWEPGTDYHAPVFDKDGNAQMASSLA